MIGRTPDNITAIRPLKDGVIADFDSTEQMLRFFIQQVHRRRYFTKPRLVICVPSGITAVEQRAVKEAGYQAGARRVYIIEEPMAAAIGAGLPVHEATGNMVVDVGGGTTEVAVISLGGIVTSLSVRTAGDELDQAIIAWMKKEYSLMLGERTAEEIKMTLGSAFPLPSEPEAEVRGRDMISGLPKTVVVSSAEVRMALEEPLHAIVDAVRTTLDQTPPELAGDIMDRGLVLTGGGALLRGLDERIRHETGMPVHIAEDPLHSVAMGAGKCVEEFEALQQVLVSEPRRVSGLSRATDFPRRPAAAPLAARVLVLLLLACFTADHARRPRRRRLARRPAARRPSATSSAPSRPVRPPRCAPCRRARASSQQRRAARRRRPAGGGELPRCAASSPTSTVARHRAAELDGLLAGPPRAPATRSSRPGWSRWAPPSRSPAPSPSTPAPPRASTADMTVLNNDGLVGRVLRADRTHLDGAAARRPGVRRGRPARHQAWRSASSAAAGRSAMPAGSTSSSPTTSVAPARDDVLVTWGSRNGAPYVAGIPIGVVTSVTAARASSSRRRP